MAFEHRVSRAQEREAIELASKYLLVEADRQFAETRHRMKFSHVAGFTGSTEDQSSDLFARATLGNLLVDIVELARGSEWATSFYAIARREAEYVARAKVRSRAGGWSYFPDLPELPPDADSLAAALSLFVRIAPEYVELCHEAVDFVLADVQPDGSFETWIVAATDTPADRARMRWGIQNCWGIGADMDVMAHMYHALWLSDRLRYKETIARGASKLKEMQQPDGSWRATWYVGSAYGTALAVRLLRETGSGENARDRARQFLMAAQNEDGTWGHPTDAPLQTSLSMSALSDVEPKLSSIQIDRGREALCERQLEDGSWHASPWIKMEIGRATGKILHVATYQSTTLTTAFCLRALLLERCSV
jgi:squalene-hopene/tetraprenyl-beta-curcumene cyclase